MKYKAPATLLPDVTAGWCPGCGHGIIVRLLGEALEKLGIEEKAIMTLDVACGSLVMNCTTLNSIGCAHGRPIIGAAGVKRVRPNDIVIAQAGDGSAYSIGIESTIHCALRNENILALVVNNNVFGMTGGQMSPASLPGQKTTSSPAGRDVAKFGNNFDVVKTLKEYDIAYLARGSVDSPKEIAKAGKMIEKALKKQMDGEGFCLVEILSPCPTNWNMSPVDSMQHIRDNVEKYYPLGEFVDKGGKTNG
ncbi:2-oxoglutarate oxidoreductase subunit KorB [bioreactor metagenome]|uniref:2-oxoglutarate oxidoreductase subunit KorB n=1 Tax=bioreactor metagenome TaxID=1076179 RepID=A0A644ZCP0_9ZZZZ